MADVALSQTFDLLLLDNQIEPSLRQEVIQLAKSYPSEYMLGSPEGHTYRIGPQIDGRIDRSFNLDFQQKLREIALSQIQYPWTVWGEKQEIEYNLSKRDNGTLQISGQGHTWSIQEICSLEVCLSFDNIEDHISQLGAQATPEFVDTYMNRLRLRAHADLDRN